MSVTVENHVDVEEGQQKSAQASPPSSPRSASVSPIVD
jgi:hypothetical protein